MVERTQDAQSNNDEQQQTEQSKPKSTWARWREYLIHNAPAPIVNNASNAVGATQLVAEVFLYKAGNNDLMTTPAGERNLLHYIVEPPKNIVGAALKKAGGTKTPFGDYFKPSFYWEGMKGLNDMKGSALRDSLNNTQKLTNRWSARSGLTGITSMTVATLLPDRKETQEETDRMANMAHDTPGRYALHRIGQALNPMEWWNNKRQFAGLGMVVTGAFSFLSGFRQIEGDFLKGETQLYRRNPWQMAGGLITTFAGGQLLMAINNQQGWTRYGTTQLARLATLPPSIYDRFKLSERGLKEQGAGWYFGGQGLMVVKNSMASLIGGAEVKMNADGSRTVVDHAAMRKAAMEKAKVDNYDARGLQPSALVSQVSARETAMPELVAAAAEKEQAAANV